MGFWVVYDAEGAEGNTERARTVAFCVMALAQLGFSFGCRSQRYTMPELGLLTNPALIGAIVVSGLLQLGVVLLPAAQPVFESARVLPWHWGLMAVLALAPVTIIEVAKLVWVLGRSRRG